MTDKHFQEINQTIYNLEELGLFKEAEDLHNLFIKEAAKKSKKKKNVPNNPSLWAECKAWAKRTFDVYPSAYANGAAAKRYKSKGGTWRKANSENTNRFAQLNLDPLSPNVLDSNYGLPPKKKKIAPATESNLGNVAPGKKPELTTVSSMPSEPKKQIPDVVPVGSQGQYGMPDVQSPEKPTDKVENWVKEFDYTDIIKTLKDYITTGNYELAAKSLNDVMKYNTKLNDAQKNALNSHYMRILNTYKGGGYEYSKPDDYLMANTLLANLTKKYPDFASDPMQEKMILNAIDNYIVPRNQREKYNAYKVISFAKRLFNEMKTKRTLK